MRTSRSQRCRGEAPQRAHAGAGAAVECGGGEQLARSVRAAAGRRWRAAACARASAARVAGSAQTMWLASLSTAPVAAQSVPQSTITRPWAARASREQGAEMLRLGLRVVRAGGEASRRRPWLELDERSRGRLPVGDLLGELARG